MSIDILIEDSTGGGKLFKLLPYEPSTRIIRLIYLAPVVMNYVASDDPRAGYLHAELDSFISGDNIVISMVPRNAATAFIGILDPPENGMFDIRSRDPRPAMRILGGFARKDVFIGLVLRTRKLLLTEKDWDVAIAECKRKWQSRFHALLPLTGASPSDYLSNCTCMDL